MKILYRCWIDKISDRMKLERVFVSEERDSEGNSHFYSNEHSREFECDLYYYSFDPSI